jgi:hypothetical protein
METKIQSLPKIEEYEGIPILGSSFELQRPNKCEDSEIQNSNEIFNIKCMRILNSHKDPEIETGKSKKKKKKKKKKKNQKTSELKT